MQKKTIKILGFLVILGTGFITLKYYENRREHSIIETDLLQEHYYDEYRLLAEKFMNHYNSEEQLKKEERINMMTQNELLHMEYLIHQNQRKAFQGATNFVRKNLYTEEGLIAFGGDYKDDYKNVEHFDKASLEDNLMFYRLLMMAYEKWGILEYKQLAEVLGEKIYTYNVADNVLYPYYDGERPKELTYLELEDLDLVSLSLLKNGDNKWKKIYYSSKALVENSYIQYSFPLYFPFYDYENKEYVRSEKIDTLYSLKTVLNLAYMDLERSETIKWIKEQIKSGGIYEQYDYATGRVTSQVERVTIYALVAQIGKVIGDAELYNLAIEKMLTFQIRADESPYKGAFLTKENNQFREYDHLQALLAF